MKAWRYNASQRHTAKVHGMKALPPSLFLSFPLASFPPLSLSLSLSFLVRVSRGKRLHSLCPWAPNFQLWRILNCLMERETAKSHFCLWLMLHPTCSQCDPSLAVLSPLAHTPSSRSVCPLPCFALPTDLFSGVVVQPFISTAKTKREKLTPN